MDDKIYEISSTFLNKLGVDYTDLEVQKEADNIYRIALKSDDSHLLIGPHGKNLEVVSSLLKLMVQKESQNYITLHVEINDYLEQKEKKLQNFIQNKINYVKESGKEVILPFFTAYERKQVHSYVSENGGNVYTQSIGEGKERRVHLCRKDEKMTIDIDGDDI